MASLECAATCSQINAFFRLKHIVILAFSDNCILHALQNASYFFSHFNIDWSYVSLLMGTLQIRAHAQQAIEPVQKLSRPDNTSDNGCHNVVAKYTQSFQPEMTRSSFRDYSITTVKTPSSTDLSYRKSDSSMSKFVVCK